MAKKTETIEITFDQKNIADLQIKEKSKIIDYDTKDFTIELMIQKFCNGDFFIPDYQRKYIWLPKDKYLFLESVFLGLPIPFLFLAECHNGNQEIVDGVQRINTITSFYKNEIKLSNLKILDQLNGFYFKDLSETQQKKFKNRMLRIVILGEDTPDNMRQLLFDRINTSGRVARDSEVRRGTYSGKLKNFIEETCKDELFKRLAPLNEKQENRRERFELTLRFFAYINKYKDFSNHVKPFLDKYLEDNMETFDEQFFKNEFDAVLKFVEKFFPCGFAKTLNATATPRVRFEAIAVGVGLALRKKPTLEIYNIDWLNSEEFKKKTTSDASNNSNKLKDRIEYVRDRLLEGSI